MTAFATAATLLIWRILYRVARVLIPPSPPLSPARESAVADRRASVSAGSAKF
jgi:hypothetical protein